MYINKNNDKAANKKIDKYLSVARTETWFIAKGAKELYSHFGSVAEKNELIDDVLLPEQQYRCCYCQRNLPNHSYGTIEHIIRQSIPDSAAMRKYFNSQFSGLNAENVCHTDDYVSGNFNKGQYPHKVAYHNFAMACPTCNSARDCQDIDPLFLYPDIDNTVIYNRNTGEVDWLTDPEILKDVPTERPTVEKVELNSPLLKAIRSVWLYGKDHPSANYSTPNTVHNEGERIELLYNAFGAALDADPNFNVQDMGGFIDLCTSELWNRLLQYDYFGTI